MTAKNTISVFKQEIVLVQVFYCRCLQCNNVHIQTDGDYYKHCPYCGMKIIEAVEVK